MKIGIDCRNIYNTKTGETAGVGHYVYFLIKYLLASDKENEYVLFLYNKDLHFREFEQANVKIAHFPGLEKISKIPFFYHHVVIPHILRLHNLDVYHGPANVTPFFYFGKSIITVHDLAIYKNAKWFPDGGFFWKKILIPWSIFKSKKIIAVSENTQRDLQQMFHVNKDKISVIHEGVEDFAQIEINEQQLSEKFKINYPYFLFIGTLEPRKNLVRLIQAYASFLQAGGDPKYKLLIAGKKGWKYEPIFQTIADLNLSDQVKYLGFIDLAEKKYLLEHAFAFVFPSLYEGFGLPIIEAMNVGVPIITSNIASIPELVIDNAILVDPENTNSIKKALQKIISDEKLRQELVKRGKGIVKNLTWESCAQKTLDLYKTLSK